jgi:tight adherence protein C
MGFDVLWIATLLSGVAMLFVLVAVYAATTVRDPMAKRVRALNDRREQLKAGIVASTSKRRAKLNQKNETTDRLRSFLGTFRMLQDEQLKAAQIKLMQAGIRSKDLAVAVIFGRLVLPIVFGGIAVFAIYYMNIMPDWTPFKKFGATAAALIGGYKAPDLFVENKLKKRTDAIRKGLPDALDLAGPIPNLVMSSRSPLSSWAS